MYRTVCCCICLLPVLSMYRTVCCCTCLLPVLSVYTVQYCLLLFLFTTCPCTVLSAVVLVYSLFCPCTVLSAVVFVYYLSMYRILLDFLNSKILMSGMQGSSCSLFNLYSLTVFDGSDDFLQILALYSTRKSVF